MNTTHLLASLLFLAAGCSGSNDTDDDSELEDSADESGPETTRLNCMAYEDLADIDTWQVHSTACEESPECPAGFEPTICSSVETGCEEATAECGNFYCEEGEDANSCAVDCRVERVPYDADSNIEIEHEGYARSYSLHLPDCYTGETALPLVVGLHGGSGTGEGFEQKLDLNALADEACFIGLYPNGASTWEIHGLKQYWNSGERPSSDWWVAYTQHVDDVGFISTLLDEVASSYSIDAAQVYVAGFSNGGRMAYRLACELDDRIAAVAVYGAPLHFEPCEPTSKVSILNIHGWDDLYNPYEGGPSCVDEGDDDVPPVSQTLETWLALNECEESPGVTTTGEVRCETRQCAESSEVIACSVAHGGHTIPGARVFPIEKWLGLGRSTTDIDGAAFTWEFFSSHAKP